MRAIALSLVLLASAADLRGQSGPIPRYRVRLLGVYDDATGAPLDSVRITDILNGNSSTTTVTGTVGLFFLPDGGSLVRLQKLGYEVQTMTIAISPADTTPVTVTLRRVTQLARTVTTAHEQVTHISPGLRGFEERRLAATSGYFVGDSILRANEGRPLANVMQSRMPSLQFVPGVAGASFLLRSARCAAGGPPQVYLDGVALSPDLRPDAPGMAYYNTPPRDIFGQPTPGSKSANLDLIAFDLSKFNASDLAGVEWYPDSDMLPIQFNHTGGRCGAVMLWTRER